MVDPNRAKKLLNALEKDDRDLLVYSGAISRPNLDRFISTLIDAKSRSRQKISLVLSTYGGDAHCAYRLARLIQDLYVKGGFRLVVLEPCKSAGTLVAVGADELAMSPFGELGPLDVQLAKDDEIAVRASGLDTLGALAMLRSEAFKAFEHYMVAIVNRSGNTVSTKTAFDVSGALVAGLFQPIAAKIDPHRMSEVDRMMKIAKEYGERLGGANLRDDSEASLERLISGYPTHEFIIDTREASAIFKTVLAPSESEKAVVELLPEQVLYPTGSADVLDVTEILESIVKDAERKTTVEAPQDETDGGGVHGVGDHEGDCGETDS